MAAFANQAKDQAPADVVASTSTHTILSLRDFLHQYISWRQQPQQPQLQRAAGICDLIARDHSLCRSPHCRATCLIMERTRGPCEKNSQNKKSLQQMDYENNNYLRRDMNRVEISQPTDWTWCYVLIGLTSILCYVNNIYGDFVHDDIKAITTNPDVRRETSLITLFSNDFWGKSMSDKKSHKSYRPICVFTFR